MWSISQHDASVTSLSITHEGPMDYKKIEAWLGNLLDTSGPRVCCIFWSCSIEGVEFAPDFCIMMCKKLLKECYK